MPSRLARRLFIGSVVIVALAAFCWLVLPRMGVSIPWWVPLIGFVVIAISAVFAPKVAEPTDGTDPNSPIPFRPPEDEGEGVSAADRERFG